MPHQLYTVGHSALEFSAFLQLLKPFDTTVLMDVRSKPQSMRFPHFDQIEMERSLQAANVCYLHTGEELGGRPDDPKAYRGDGLVDYRARRKARSFQAGIERIIAELEQHSLALMCAEEDPLSCHRFLMICPELVALGIDPQHIRKGGVIDSQRECEDRLMEAHQLGAMARNTLFPFDRATALEDAYAAQSEKVAFRIDPRVLEPW